MGMRGRRSHKSWVSAVCQLSAPCYQHLKAFQPGGGLWVAQSSLKGKSWNTAPAVGQSWKSSWSEILSGYRIKRSYSTQDTGKEGFEERNCKDFFWSSVSCGFSFSEFFSYFICHGFFVCETDAVNSSSGAPPLLSCVPYILSLPWHSLFLFSSSLWWRLPHGWRYLRQPWLPWSLSF